MQKNPLKKYELKDSYFSNFDLLDKIISELKNKMNLFGNSCYRYVKEFNSLKEIFTDYENVVEIIKQEEQEQEKKTDQD